MVDKEKNCYSVSFRHAPSVWQEDESINHLFVQCDRVFAIWVKGSACIWDTMSCSR